MLDVGCGTGRLLAGVRAAGHGGRLVGLDPDRAALEVAWRTEVVEWVEGTAEAMTWQREFALATTTSHALRTTEGTRSSPSRRWSPERAISSLNLC